MSRNRTVTNGFKNNRSVFNQQAAGARKGAYIWQRNAKTAEAET